MPEPIPLPSKLNIIQQNLLAGEVIESIRTVFDPEIPVNVYDLGLIYDLVVNEDAEVAIKMTLTSPNCPVAETLPMEVQEAAAKTPGVTHTKLELVWDPPFSIDRIPEHIQLELGFL
ncbi:MAG: DUF59 domain-containing protein [Chthonomonas sp.]|nr:DUF59 domain-containing protein [Chthonomonas sp.]